MPKDYGNLDIPVSVSVDQLPVYQSVASVFVCEVEVVHLFHRVDHDRICPVGDVYLVVRSQGFHLIGRDVEGRLPDQGRIGVLPRVQGRFFGERVRGQNPKYVGVISNSLPDDSPGKNQEVIYGGCPVEGEASGVLHGSRNVDGVTRLASKQENQ